jgi:signal peptidase I
VTPTMPMATADGEDCKLGLAVEALRRCGAVRLKVWGTSMLPSLWPGDLLILQTATRDDVIPGDIVLVLRGKRCFIHRLVAKQPAEDRVAFITCGDGMPHHDPPVAAVELLGRVIGVRRGSRSFVPSRQVSPFDSALAWLLGRSDRLRGLVLRIHGAHLHALNQYSHGSSSFGWEDGISGMSALQR